MTDVIDIHPHVISPDTERYPLSPLGGKQSTWSASHSLPYEDLIVAMDEAGVDKAVVVQASTAYGHDNTYLAQAVAAYPDRLTGVFSVDVLAGDAIERIGHWQDKGLKGLRLFTAGTTMKGQGKGLGDPASYPAWDYASKVGLPICVQMRPEGIPMLRDLAERFPEATIVLDHLARSTFDDGPPYRDADPLWGLARYPGIHLKLTHRSLDSAGTGASTHEAFLKHLLNRFGPGRVAWGSNFPAAGKPLGTILQEARDALSSLSEEDRKAIFGGTARALYPTLREMKGLVA